MRQLVEVRMVLRAPQAARTAEPAADIDLIAPIERGLGVLAAFREGDVWLGNSEIALRTGIPKATVTRLTQTLTAEGLLNHSLSLRKYRLAPAVLSLGFASAHSFDLAAAAHSLLQQFADDCGVFAALASRSGLDTTIVQHCHSTSTLMTPALGDGAHFPLEATPLGLALLAGVPECEREYLLEHIRMRHPAEDRVALRQRVREAVEQVRSRGWCASTHDFGVELVVAAAPLIIPEHPAFVIGCAAPAASLPKGRLVEFVGPRLAASVDSLRAKATMQMAGRPPSAAESGTC